MKYKERIILLREEKALTKKEIAMLLHVSPQTYSDYEHGKIKLSLDSLIILAKFYDVSIDYIIGTTQLRKPYPNK